MREILFRGRQEDNGEWVYGRLLADDVIVPKGQEFYTPHNILDSALHAYTVLTETVGQYIGLKDKNGKKIFEGDIVRNPETSDVGAICFEPNTATFVIEFDSIIVNFYDYNNVDVEVIGNIYDNSIANNQK